eukprot:9468064-Pyramimonas_sp.AAC.1
MTSRHNRADVHLHSNPGRPGRMCLCPGTEDLRANDGRDIGVVYVSTKKAGATRQKVSKFSPYLATSLFSTFAFAQKQRYQKWTEPNSL